MASAAATRLQRDAAMPRILIVEDERIVAFNLKQRLIKLGYDVPALAASGTEAMTLVRELHPDIILMDINIEGELDGIRTAARIADEASTPVIYLTAYSEDKTLERARGTRPYGYLLKPVSERELHATIQMALERRAVEVELETARRSIKELNVGLEHKIAERTAELSAANDDLRAFSYSVAHDLRAGVRAIGGFSGILTEQYALMLDARGQGYLKRIRAAAANLGSMIDGLLELARISRQALTSGDVDLSALALEIAGAIRETDPQREVEFVIQPGLAARGDARMLRIVLDNLLRNAWKFTSRHPSARIEFGADAQGGAGRYFVRDDGAGFDMEHAAKLFGAFERLHTTGEFEGTGIGLATVRRAIARLGGTISAEAEPERGATFWFTLGA